MYASYPQSLVIDTGAQPVVNMRIVSYAKVLAVLGEVRERIDEFVRSFL